MADSTGVDADLEALKAQAIALRESGDKVGALAKVREIRALKAQRIADERQMAIELAQMKGVQWARGLLVDAAERKKVCDTEFKRQDGDNNGVLDKIEAFTVIERMCAQFELALPRTENVSELFSRCDKNGDGVIEMAEFRNYFKVVLESCVRKAESELAARYKVTLETVAATSPWQAAAAGEPPLAGPLGAEPEPPAQAAPPQTGNAPLPLPTPVAAPSEVAARSTAPPSPIRTAQASPLEKVHAQRPMAGSPTAQGDGASQPTTSPLGSGNGKRGGSCAATPSAADVSPLEGRMIEQRPRGVSPRLAAATSPRKSAGNSPLKKSPGSPAAKPPPVPPPSAPSPAPYAPPPVAQAQLPAVQRPRATLSFREVAQLKGVEWARALLSSAEVRRALCNAEFSAADRNHDGTLDRAEALACVARTCERFELRLPAAERCAELFVACDTSRDGVIQLTEFYTFFGTLLESCVRQAEEELGVDPASYFGGKFLPSGASSSLFDHGATAADADRPPRLAPPSAADSSDAGDKVSPLADLATPPSYKTARSPPSPSSTSSTFPPAMRMQVQLGYPRPQNQEFLVNRKLMAGFNTWRIGIASWVGMLDKSLSHWLNYEVLRGWNRWTKRFADEARVSVCLQQCLRNASSYTLARGWRAWVEMLELKQECHRLLRLGVSRFTHGRLPLALASWRYTLELQASKERLADAMRTALLHLLSHRLARGWNGWLSMAVGLAQSKALLRNGLHHLRERGVSRGWNAWAEAAELRRMWEHRMRVGMRVFVTARKAQGWNGWKYAMALAARKATTAERMGYGVKRMRGVRVGRAWNTWRSVCDERRALLDALRRGGAHLAHSLPARCWNAWAAAARERVKAHTQVRRGLAFMLHTRVAPAFARWMHSIRHDVHRARTDSKRHRALRALANHRLQRGFISWSATLEARAATLRIIRRGIVSWSQHGLTRGWNAWKEMTECRNALLHRIRVGGRMLLQRDLAIRIGQWVAFVEGQRMLTRGLSHLLDRQCGLAWNKWRSLHRLRRQVAAAMRRGEEHDLQSFTRSGRFAFRLASALRHFRNRGLSRGWHAWCDAHALTQTTMERIHRAVSHWKNHALAVGWNSWAELAEEHAHLYAMVDRALSHMRNRGMSAAFATLRAHTEDAQRIIACVPGMIHRDVRAAFNTWVSHHDGWYRSHDMLHKGLVALHVHERSRALRAWVELVDVHARWRSMLRRAVLFFLQHKEGPAINAWRASVAQEKERARGAALVNRALHFMKKRGLARATLTWLGFWRETYRKRDLVHGAFKRLAKRGLARGWTTWAAKTSAAKRFLMSASRCVQALILNHEKRAFAGWVFAHKLCVTKLANAANAARYLRQHKRARAWRTWAEVSAQRGGGHVAIMKRSLAFLTLHDMSRGWKAWHDLWAELARKIAALRLGAGHLLHGRRSRCWNTWIAYGAARGRSTRLLLQGVHLFMRNLAALGFSSWKDYLRIERSRRSKTGSMTHALRHIVKRRCYGQAWATWASASEAKYALRRKLQRTMGHLMNRKLSRSWNSWAPWADGRKRNVRRLKQALGFLVHKHRAHALAGWRATLAYFKEKREKNETVTRAIVRMSSRRSVYRGWNEWHAVWTERDRARRALTKCLGHARHRLLSRVYVAWQVHVAEMQAAIDFAAMQFSHVVVVRPPSGKPSPKGSLADVSPVQRLWKCSEDAQKDYALLHAAQEGHLATVRVLSARGARVGVRDAKDQRNALHIAAFEGFLDIVRVLLDVDHLDEFLEARDLGGNTAYMLACMRGFLTIMRVLKEHGADERADEHDGLSGHRPFPMLQ